MGQKDEIILININGTDRPGVTAALTEILAKNNAVILDIGQADIHNNLSLGILFQSSEGNSGDILKELLFKSYELDVNIRFLGGALHLCDAVAGKENLGYLVPVHAVFSENQTLATQVFGKLGIGLTVTDYITVCHIVGRIVDVFGQHARARLSHR